MKRSVCGVVFVILVGCPGVRNIKVYRNLSEPGAMKLCDANTSAQFNITIDGRDEAEVKAAGTRAIQRAVSNGDKSYCGAYIHSEAAGKRLDAGWNYGATYQSCRCE
jgi:hypothetical protein